MQQLAAVTVIAVVLLNGSKINLAVISGIFQYI